MRVCIKIVVILLLIVPMLFLSGCTSECTHCRGTGRMRGIGVSWTCGHCGGRGHQHSSTMTAVAITVIFGIISAVGAASKKKPPDSDYEDNNR